MDKKPYLKETLLCTSSLPLPPLPLPLMLLPLSLSLMPPSLSLSLLPLCVFPWFLYLSSYSRSALNRLSKILTRPDPGLAKLSRKIRCGVSERNLVSWLGVTMPLLAFAVRRLLRPLWNLTSKNNHRKINTSLAKQFCKLNNICKASDSSREVKEMHSF